MTRLLATAFAVLLCLPASARDFKVLNAPSPGDPVYVIPPGICGNGVLEDGEECDPGYPDLGVEPDMGDATCETQGFNGGGEVTCTAKCTVDTSACDCDVSRRFPSTGQTRCWSITFPFMEIGCVWGTDGGSQAGAMLAYTDNGDGTVTDDNTGLMWEKKNDDGGVHDKDDQYLWEASLTDFIDTLNNTCDGNGVIRCDTDDICGAGGQCGFAGYRTWRMPNVKELQSIVHYDRLVPSVHHAFNAGCVDGCTDCSCTASDFYWSSTALPNSNGAWKVGFAGGIVNIDGKVREASVRAVRGR